MSDSKQLKLNGEEKIAPKPIRVIDNTMAVMEEKDEETEYIVLKFAGKTYSTFHKKGTGILSPDIKISRKQKVETFGVGKQNNFWIKGVFTEGSGHEKIDAIPFELNIYSGMIKKDFEKK